MIKKILKIIIIFPLALVLIIAIALLGYQIWQPISKELRHTITVDLTVLGPNNRPLSDCVLKFREYGWRRIVPIQFAKKWMSKGKTSTYSSDKKGNVIVLFNDDYLGLEEVSYKGIPIKEYVSERHIYTGTIFKQNNKLVKQWGFHPKAKHPYKAKYILRTK